MAVTAAEARRMADDPAVYFGGVGYEAQHLPVGDLKAMQLLGLQQRFAHLRNRVPVLQTLAEEQKIEDE